MKKLFRNALFFAMSGTLTLSTVACSSDNNGNGGTDLATQNAEIQSITQRYLNDVVYPTYSNLAIESEGLYNKIAALKAKLNAGTNVNQSEIDAICSSYKAARNYWEESEAFLYGAATDFNIDPHIDTWPLAVETLAKDLSNKDKITGLNANTGVDFARKNLIPDNLGFHGIEFIFFRDGKNRPATFFNNNEKENYVDPNGNAYFKNVTVTGKEEVIFASAVAGDLRDKCYQLEVAWEGNKAPANHIARVAECAKNFDDFGTLTKTGLSYGEDLLAANTPKSSLASASWKKVLETIFISGCSNICAEVADQKMGQAYRTHTSSSPTYHEGEDGNKEEDDPNYIESPYSYNSFTDFYDNIQSIQNSLYGNYNQSAYSDNSIMAYLTAHNAAMATNLQSKLTAALLALKACQNSNKAFVQNPGAPYVKTAMDAVSALDDALTETSKWVLAN